MGILYGLLRNWRPRAVSSVFGKAQLVSAGAMGFMHGTNDAQKTMGIIALALLAGTTDGKLDALPGWLGFLKTYPPAEGQEFQIAMWIKILCAVVWLRERQAVAGESSKRSVTRWFAFNQFTDSLLRPRRPR